MSAPRLAIAPLLLLVGLASASDSWPAFRGPGNQGHSDATGLPLQWSESEHVAWKTALPGVGWSSPVVADGAAWMTAALDDGRSLHAFKVDVASGKLLADIEVFTNDKVPAKHDRNSHASPSPVLADGRVYVHFGAMGTACLAAKDGAKLWENRSLVINHSVGAGGSPALWHDRLFLTCDGIDDQYGVALDAMTGKELWRAKRTATARLGKIAPENRKCFGTPIVFTIDGQEQVLTAAAERLYAHDPQSGKELWFVDYIGYSNASIPVSDGKILILPTGFDHSEVWGIRLGGASGDATASHVAWKLKLPSLSQPSPLLVDGRAYIVNDSGIMSCLDAATGKQLWKERVGVDFAASPILSEGRIYLFDCRGKATVIAASAEFKVLATSQLDDGCMASPAVVGKALIVRTKKNLYRLE
jgi:outer membrane protein assembly factor BamB